MISFFCKTGANVAPERYCATNFLFLKIYPNGGIGRHDGLKTRCYLACRIIPGLGYQLEVFALVMELADMLVLETKFWGFDFPLGHHFSFGRLAEWSIAAVLKAVESGNRHASSNLASPPVFLEAWQSGNALVSKTS